ncbi:hypothetical protein SPRG_11313 [Saprolegnia parasitica CBS 223.65]|uniref:GH18 domain-containing protein n=1 Tax=Saprolegnia parasitica (strain CBS 223.65) TaxID=695850 RepID=A0A067C740_SAPPC|nr:hypothetical protein SPRG_11313 [Saprolegnia parasitica CBS 223.65]KDO22361.1 hypothetical protein SPRG_11313 [Saprolegnia parasitica CBS 223.65]|eukprot:XP_012206885.1 hypothetical protein SPRG_11313 [Saprolegnia parasitica CBS 223.65]
MGRTVLVVLWSLLAVSAMAAWNALEQASLAACPCAEASLCLPVASGRRFEVFAFSPAASDNWRYYDYSVLTTIAWNLDKGLLCHAHAHRVKIVVLHNFEHVDQLCNASAREAWVHATYTAIVTNYADGVNVDTEAAITRHDHAACLTLLLQELRVELQAHAFTRHAQITFDVAWSPSGIDQRYYDYAGLAAAADYVFVMAYDMRSQLYDHCLAGANSPIAQVQRGLDDYVYGAKVPKAKLLLGLPWYAYQYPCRHYDPIADLCSLSMVPFRGAPCSDAAGSQLDYRDVMAQLHTTKRRWDNVTATPYFVHRNATGGVVQTWYDDPESLQAKFALAADLGGLGMWHVDALDYSGKHTPTASTRAMWQVLHDAVPPTTISILSDPVAFA